MTNIYTFNGSTLRTVEIDGEPWFVASDVCRILGLRPNAVRGSYSNHLRRLDAGEKRPMLVADVPTPQNGGLPPRRPQTVMTESGLYKMIMRSDKDTARPFQDWVTKEVLPAVRKTGGYLLNEATRETAHADTREEAPLPDWLKSAFDDLRREVCNVRAELFDHRKMLAESNAMLEKLSNGENPEPVWLSNDGPIPVGKLDDAHLRRAISSCRKHKWEGRAIYDALLSEQQRRRTTAEAIAKREAENAKRRAEAARVLAEAREKAEALLAQIH